MSIATDKIDLDSDTSLSAKEYDTDLNYVCNSSTIGVILIR